MIPKILIALTTTIFTELFLLLYQQDNPYSFIPLIETVASKTVSAYDFFLIISLFQIKIMYNSFGINSAYIRSLINIFSNIKPIEILLIALAGVITHYFICPILLAFFHDPLQAIMNSTDSIRKTVLMQIPLFWIFIVSIIQSRVSANSFYSSGNIPQPPNWP